MSIVVHGTAQELFDKSATHLLTQMEKSSMPRNRGLAHDDKCMYLHPSGTKCAIGCLLNDDDCRTLDDGDETDIGGLFSHEIVQFPELLPDKRGDAQTLLQELQECHDDFEPEDWQQVLGAIADKFGLVLHVSA